MILSNASYILERLKEKFSDALIEIEDPRQDDQHLRVKITSGAFSQKSLVMCHRMVYEALGDLMKERLHALSIETKVP